MIVKHLFNDRLYLITNQSVALNPLFKSEYYSTRFLHKMEHYLSPLCHIIHYVLDNDQFQIIVRLRSRDEFCKYYIEKHRLPVLHEVEMPPSSYIFSQAMANLQASTAIHFNRIENRSGALFKQRFKKIKIDSKEELDSWIEHLNDVQKFQIFGRKWKDRSSYASRKRWKNKLRSNVLRSAVKFYRGVNERHPILSSFLLSSKIDLETQFKKSTQASLNMIFHLEIFVFKPPDN